MSSKGEGKDTSKLHLFFCREDMKEVGQTLPHQLIIDLYDEDATMINGKNGYANDSYFYLAAMVLGLKF